MTIQPKKLLKRKAKIVFFNIKHKRSHLLQCGCGACLYHQYRNRKHGKGRPIGQLAFFLNWLIFEVKMEHLINKGYAEGIEFHGRKGWKLKPGEFEKAPYVKRTKEILNELLDEDDLFQDLITLFDSSSTYRIRIEQEKFHKLTESLYQERWLEWKKSHQADLNEISGEDLQFAKRVADFIERHPKKHVSRRELLRHFSDKRIKDLERIKIILVMLGIDIEENVGYRKRQTFYRPESLTWTVAEKPRILQG